MGVRWTHGVGVDAHWGGVGWMNAGLGWSHVGLGWTQGVENPPAPLPVPQADPAGSSVSRAARKVLQHRAAAAPGGVWE